MKGSSGGELNSSRVSKTASNLGAVLQAVESILEQGGEKEAPMLVELKDLHNALNVHKENCPPFYVSMAEDCVDVLTATLETQSNSPDFLAVASQRLLDIREKYAPDMEYYTSLTRPSVFKNFDFQNTREVASQLGEALEKAKPYLDKRSQEYAAIKGLHKALLVEGKNAPAFYLDMASDCTKMLYNALEKHSGHTFDFDNSIRKGMEKIDAKYAQELEKHLADGKGKGGREL